MTFSSDELCERKYEEVRRMAYARMRRQSASSSYQATDLAHDALLRLHIGKKHSWTSVDSFMTAVAGNQKRVLIDRFRYKNALKRDKGRSPQHLGDRTVQIFDHRFSELEMEEMIERYGTEVCPVKATLIHMRWQGFRREETMKALQISPASYDRYLQSAKKRICLWLLDGVESGN